MNNITNTDCATRVSEFLKHNGLESASNFDWNPDAKFKTFIIAGDPPGYVRGWKILVKLKNLIVAIGNLRIGQNIMLCFTENGQITQRDWHEIVKMLLLSSNMRRKFTNRKNSTCINQIWKIFSVDRLGNVSKVNFDLENINGC